MNFDYRLVDSEVFWRPQQDEISLLPIDFAREHQLEYGRSVLHRPSAKKKKWLLAEAGFCLKVAQNHQAKQPITGCFDLTREDCQQTVHNLIILEPNSKLDFWQFCQADRAFNLSSHSALTEIYLNSGAELNLLIWHDWRSGTAVESELFINLADLAKLNVCYVSLSAPRKLRAMSKLSLTKSSAKANYDSLLLVDSPAQIQINQTGFLRAKQTSLNLTSQIINGAGNVKIQTNLLANLSAQNSQAHSQCDGLQLSASGKIESIPRIKSQQPSTALTHEASVGQIDQTALDYLQCRGLSLADARRLLIGGFAESALKSVNLPKDLTDALERKIEQLAKKNLKEFL